MRRSTSVRNSKSVGRLFGLFGALILAITVLPMPVASANGETPIGTSTTLVGDHYGSIVITAADVALDCDGHRVIGEGEGFGVLVEGHSGATVKNCHIENFDRGVMMYGSHGSTIENNTFTGNNFAVMGVDGSHSNAIKGNDIVGGIEGVSLFGSEETNTYSNLVEGNTVTGAGEAFQFRYMTDSRIIGNTASDGFNGFAIGDSSFNNQIKDNIAVGNEFGISLFTDANQNLVTENSIKRNWIGILASEQSSYNTISENRIEHNELVGFGAIQESVWNEVTENRFCNNGFAFGNAPDSPTTYTDNKVCGGGN